MEGLKVPKVVGPFEPFSLWCQVRIGKAIGDLGVQSRPLLRKCPHLQTGICNFSFRWPMMLALIAGTLLLALHHFGTFADVQENASEAGGLIASCVSL